MVVFLYVKESTLELKYNGEPDKMTAKIRSTLYFLQLIENKITQQVHYQDFEDNNGFYRYMAIYLK